jgi:hypothetical protein
MTFIYRHIMKTIIMDHVMLPSTISVPRGPDYMTVRIQYVNDHVHSMLPSFLQGTSGIIQLISSFVGNAHRWIYVSGDVSLLYKNRDKDMYFLFWVCSHRLPIPKKTLQSQCQHSRRRIVCIDRASQMLPLGHNGLFFTRTGHLGTSQELSPLIRTLSCRGYVTRVKPVVPTVGRHLVITHEPTSWDYVPYGTMVMNMNHIHHLDPSIQWDTVILDNIQAPVPSVCALYPDDRHLSGSICTTWVFLDSLLLMRKTTIVYVRYPVTDIDIVDYMFITQTRYKREQFIGSTYTQERSSIMRVAETMFLDGIYQL